MVLQASRVRKPPTVTWEKLPDGFVLPDDPVENIQQPYLAAALTDARLDSEHQRNEALAAKLRELGIDPETVQNLT